MASELKRYVEEHPPSGPFSPFTSYDAGEDALTFYFHNDPDYSKRIDEILTVHLALDTDELVGCEIKGVRRILEDIGSFRLMVGDRRVKLVFVFLALVGAGDDRTRDLYRKLGEAAAESDAELEMPELVA
jgi:hypothetical protein